MQIERLFDIAEYQLANFPQPVCVESFEDGKMRSYSTEEFIRTSESLALGLMSIGIKPGDKVAVCSGNRSEWAIVDQALLRIGAISVPIYPTSSADDYAYVLDHSATKVFFVSNAELLAKATEAKEKCPELTHLFSFERIDGTPNWKELLGKGTDGKATLEQYKAKVERMALATIIYTSGTTGRPKGVMLSHDNVLSNVEASTPRLPVSVGARAISFLPLCHIYERMLMYLYQRAGTQVRFQETMEELGTRIREAEPDVFTAVPRLLEKIYDSILVKGEMLTGVKRMLFYWSLKLGERYEVHGRSAWYNMQLAIARKLVFSKWRAALGGKVKVVASGSAALQPRLARIFNAAGIPLMEGYGLTETSPVVSVNDARNDGLRFGTVGKPLDKVQVRIAEDGEVLVKGPNVMMGYYREPEMTAKVLTPDGWFHTGDIGEISKDGFLRITDRKKEMFKTSGGKYVAPQLIENKLKASRFIEHVMVIGENRRFPAALIVPSFNFLKDYCKLKGITYTSNEQIVQDPVILARVKEEVDEVNATLGNWEQIKKIALLPKDWAVDTGEMTPKLSLRRKPILTMYEKQVEGIYGEA